MSTSTVAPPDSADPSGTARRERGQLFADLTFLREQLVELPANAALPRRSIEARVRTVEADLARLPTDDSAPAP